MKVSFHTLGCKLNYAESSTLARRFAAAGYGRVERGAGADVCVVNSCTVTGEADKKCRNLVRRLIRENPGAVVAVTGCYAQLKPDEIAAIPGVDIVVGNDAKASLFERVEWLVAQRRGVPAAAEVGDEGPIAESPERAGEGAENPTAGASGAENPKAETPEVSGKGAECGGFFAAYSIADRTRSFLKVQDGCDYRCAYCAVPAARGASRNIPISEAVRGAEEIAASGCREIVLTGINTGDFGRTTGERFIDLLRALEPIRGVERYRISSIEPNLLTDEIIEFTARSEKFMPHFHIPLQSGSDTVLAAMRRRYTASTFAARVEAVRRVMPDAFIGVDVIVGFPGETDADFQRTRELLERVRPSFLHIFPYSVREGTPAAGFSGKVPAEISAARAADLSELSGEFHRRFAERFVGTDAPVLFESTPRGGSMSGLTPQYLRVWAPYDPAAVGRQTTVRVTGFEANGDLRGII